MKNQIAIIFSLIILFMAFPIAAQESTPSILSQLAFLPGEWVGEGGGNDPGQAAGTFTFAYDLQNTVIVRLNHADYPASGDKAGVLPR